MANNSIKDTDGLNATMNLFTNATPTTVNFATSATALTIGAATGTCTVKNPTFALDNGSSNTYVINANGRLDFQSQYNAAVGASNMRFNPIDAGGTHACGFQFFRSTNTSGTVSVDFFKGDNTATSSFRWVCGASPAYYIYDGSGTVVFTFAPAAPAFTCVAPIAVNHASGITTNQTTFPLLNATATTINFAGAATTLNIGAATGTCTIANATVAFSGATAFNCTPPATFTGLITANNGITMADAKNIALNTTTGTKIGTATTQKLSFWNQTPAVQPSSTGEATGYTGGGGTALTHTDTFTGNTGTKAYTINDIVKHLKTIGLLASS